MTRETLNVGLIGSGFMGQAHADAYRRAAMLYRDLPMVPVLHTLADATPDLARAAAERFGFARSTGDWRGMVADPDIDLVDITTPNAMHVEMAMAAIEAGKHIFCEKPLTVTLEDARRLTEAAEARDVKTMVAFNNVKTPAALLARQLVARGDIGRPTRFRGWFDQGFFNDPEMPWSWRCSRQEAGSGSLGDLGSHAISVAQVLMGGIESVAGQAQTFFPTRPAPGGARGDGPCRHDLPRGGGDGVAECRADHPPHRTSQGVRPVTDHATRHAGTAAIVTGGAQGVGFAIAARLAEEGARKIMLAGRDGEKGARAVERLAALGAADAAFTRTDLEDTADCRRLVEAALEWFETVTALVNAAALGARGTLLDTDEALWDRIFATNARAPFFLMQDFVRHRLERGGGGAILNILSICAHCGQSYLAAYSGSKGALATLTRNVANAHRADRIRCNAILPGWMDTPGEDATQRRFHGATDGWLERAEAGQPMGQLAKPDQLAGLASYLLCDESAGIMTGALVDYDQNVTGAYPE